MTGYVAETVESPGSRHTVALLGNQISRGLTLPDTLLYKGAMREPDKFGQRQLWVCGFGPLFFLGGGEAANIWSIHGNTEREHQMDELGA